jgi:hypothetical protein
VYLQLLMVVLLQIPDLPDEDLEERGGGRDHEDRRHDGDDEEQDAADAKRDRRRGGVAVVKQEVAGTIAPSVSAAAAAVPEPTGRDGGIAAAPEVAADAGDQQVSVHVMADQPTAVLMKAEDAVAATAPTAEEQPAAAAAGDGDFALEADEKLENLSPPPADIPSDAAAAAAAAAGTEAAIGFACDSIPAAVVEPVPLPQSDVIEPPEDANASNPVQLSAVAADLPAAPAPVDVLPAAAPATAESVPVHDPPSATAEDVVDAGVAPMEA